MVWGIKCKKLNYFLPNFFFALWDRELYNIWHIPVVHYLSKKNNASIFFGIDQTNCQSVCEEMDLFKL